MVAQQQQQMLDPFSMPLFNVPPNMLSNDQLPHDLYTWAYDPLLPYQRITLLHLCLEVTSLTVVNICINCVRSYINQSFMYEN